MDGPFWIYGINCLISSSIEGLTQGSSNEKCLWIGRLYCSLFNYPCMNYIQSLRTYLVYYIPIPIKVLFWIQIFVPRSQLLSRASRFAPVHRLNLHRRQSLLIGPHDQLKFVPNRGTFFRNYIGTKRQSVYPHRILSSWPWYDTCQLKLFIFDVKKRTFFLGSVVAQWTARLSLPIPGNPGSNPVIGKIIYCFWKRQK